MVINDYSLPYFHRRVVLFYKMWQIIITLQWGFNEMAGASYNTWHKVNVSYKRRKGICLKNQTQDYNLNLAVKAQETQKLGHFYDRKTFCFLHYWNLPRLSGLGIKYKVFLSPWNLSTWVGFVREIKDNSGFFSFFDSFSLIFFLFRLVIKPIPA